MTNSLYFVIVESVFVLFFLPFLCLHSLQCHFCIMRGIFSIYLSFLIHFVSMFHLKIVIFQNKWNFWIYGLAPEVHCTTNGDKHFFYNVHAGVLICVHFQSIKWPHIKSDLMGVVGWIHTWNSQSWNLTWRGVWRRFIYLKFYPAQHFRKFSDLWKWFFYDSFLSYKYICDRF